MDLGKLLLDPVILVLLGTSLVSWWIIIDRTLVLYHVAGADKAFYKGLAAHSAPLARLRDEFDRLAGGFTVNLRQVATDPTPFQVEHDPGNPAADGDGNVKLPNVNMMLELADMREASRSYEANLQMLKQVRTLATMTIDLLRNG